MERLVLVLSMRDTEAVLSTDRDLLPVTFSEADWSVKDGVNVSETSPEFVIVVLAEMEGLFEMKSVEVALPLRNDFVRSWDNEKDIRAVEVAVRWRLSEGRMEQVAV